MIAAASRSHTQQNLFFPENRINYFARIRMISGSMLCQNSARIVPNGRKINIE